MKIIWRQKVAEENCPYLVRWCFITKWFSIRLHHWLKSDDLRHEHDHGWNFISIVLWGRIKDKSDGTIKSRGPLSITFFPATHRHSVVVDKPCWTLLITGSEYRTWGYWVKNKFRKRNKYFFENGHHNPCEDD